jgi:hypothetical protein
MTAGPRHLPAASHTMGEIEAIEGAIQLGIARVEAERLLDRAKQIDPENSSPASLLREMLQLRNTRV